MSEEKRGITHKELLTFSNLTSLEWEFINLEEVGEEERSSNQLNDLLTPEVFVRHDSEKDAYFYSYVEGEFEEERTLTDEEKKEGLSKMRKKAGIAMEYLEKEEGDFLSEWEVIYGGDRYEIVREYLDERWNSIIESLEPDDFVLEPEDFASFDEYEDYNPYQAYEELVEFDIYNDRDEYEKLYEEKTRIEFYADVVDGIFKIGAGALPPEKNNLMKVITKQVMEKTAIDFASKKSQSLAIMLVLFLKPGDIKAILNQADAAREAEEYIEKMIKDLDEEMDAIETYLRKEDETEIKLIEEIDLFDQGRYDENIEEFRVLALKKDDEIVIAYKGKELEEEKILPDELDCLQMVYSKIRDEYAKANITFTGYNGGADLSFINALFASQKQSYEVEAGDTLWEIADKLIGESSAWNELRKTDGSTFTEKEAKELQIGKKLSYSPAENGNARAKLFYDEIGQLKKRVNFSYKNIDSDYKPVMQFVVSGINTGVGAGKTKALSIILGVAKVGIIKSLQVGSLAIATKKLFAMGLTGTAIISGLISTGVAVITTIIVSSIVYFLVNGLGYSKSSREIKQAYQKLLELDFIKKEQQGITGYITDDFLEVNYVELEAEIVDVYPKETKTIKVKKEDAIFLIINGLGEAIKYKEDNLINKKDSVAIDSKIEIEAEKGFFIVDSPKDYPESFFRLQKLSDTDNDIYKIKGNVTYRPDQGVMDSWGFLNDVSAQHLFEGYMFTNTIKILANMQRSYKDYAAEIFEFIYPSNSGEEIEYSPAGPVSDQVKQLEKPEIKVVQSIPDKNKKPTWAKKSFFNEFYFLPFIDKETGNLGDELREDYIASVIKSAIQREVQRDNKLCINEYELDSDEIKFTLVEDSASYSISVTSKDRKITETEINQTLFNTILVNQDKIDKFSNLFNYYELIISQLKEDDLSDFYNFKAKKEDAKRFKLTGIKINSPSKDKLEYKYNQKDRIIGGGLALVINTARGEIDAEFKETSFVKVKELKQNSKRRTRYYEVEISKMEIKDEYSPFEVANNYFRTTN